MNINNACLDNPGAFFIGCASSSFFLCQARSNSPFSSFIPLEYQTKTHREFGGDPPACNLTINN